LEGKFRLASQELTTGKGARECKSIFSGSRGC